MVSLWGSKKGDDSAADGTQHENNGPPHEEAASRHSEADERTRLLPPPSRHDGFLSPDDPAVSYSPLKQPQNDS